MERQAITKAVIDEAIIPEGKDRIIIRDSKIIGFCVVKHKTGRISYYYETRVNGKNTRNVIGQGDQMPIQKARERAEKIKAELTLGKDPFASKNRLQSEPTFKEFSELYLERHSRPHKRSHKKDEIRLKKYFTAFERTKLSKISREDVSRWHVQAGEESGPYLANRNLALLRSMMNLGRDWGILPESHSNPAERIKPYREVKRDRFLGQDEIVRFFDAVRSEADPIWRGYFLLLVLMGSRKTELLSASWDQFDLTGMLWRIPTTKNGRPHVLPLTPPVIQILESLPSRNKSPWVFPSDRKEGHRVEEKSAWNRIRENAGIKDVRIHDLRRTLGSWLAMSGHSLHLIGSILNHTQPSTTAIYARFSNDPKAKALSDVQDQMLSLAGKEIDKPALRVVGHE